MTQLEEYQEQLKKYKEEIKAVSSIIKDKNTAKEDKAKATRRYSVLRRLKEDIEIQIRAIDPCALPTRQAKYVRRTQVAYNVETMFHTPGKSDNYQLDPEAPVVEWMKEATKQLYSRQAEAINLYYNQGFSFAKCDEIMGVPRGKACTYAKRGLRLIKLWVEIRTLVCECALSSPFDWDRFLDEMDILTPQQLDKLLILMDCKEGELISLTDFAKYCGLRSESLHISLRRLKSVLVAVGIPEDEINNVHPLFRRYAPSVKPYIVHKILQNVTRAKAKQNLS